MTYGYSDKLCPSLVSQSVPTKITRYRVLDQAIRDNYARNTGNWENLSSLDSFLPYWQYKCFKSWVLSWHQYSRPPTTPTNTMHHQWAWSNCLYMHRYLFTQWQSEAWRCAQISISRTKSSDYSPIITDTIVRCRTRKKKNSFLHSQEMWRKLYSTGQNFPQFQKSLHEICPVTAHFLILEI